MTDGVHAVLTDPQSGPDKRREATGLGSTGQARTDYSRRQFLGVLGTALAVAAGVSGTASGQQRPTVSMGSNAFDPIGLHVEPGTTVRFEIADGSHSATAYEDRIPTGASPFDSGIISEGGFEQTFETPGTYDYYCTPHQSMGMVGRIVVGEPGGPAEASSIPDGAVPDSETIVERGTVPLDEFDGSGDDGSATMGSGSGKMGSGSGMMSGRHQDWMWILPIGFLSTFLGLVGGVVYWASRQGETDDPGDESAMTTLRERYARGEIDEEEYEARSRRLREGEDQ